MVNEPTLIGILQASLAPVTVISGAGLLLGAMTNRYGRTSDRIRVLMRDYRTREHDRRAANAIVTEVVILYRRARLIRTEIVAVAVSIFFVSVTIFSLFFNLVYGASLDKLAQTFFLLSLCSLIVAMLFFIADIVASLKALRVVLSAEPELFEACSRRIRWLKQIDLIDEEELQRKE
ncbi:MAG: DUF2721 domain-containing protein [Proteobacteria bacterium]|nr:DUF2721 domain-containing protein [Pseudomonadota bacterium]